MRIYLRNNPPPKAFDPDVISILCSALDEACEIAEASKEARLALARSIVEIASQGERDRNRLVEGALANLRLVAV